MTVMKIGYCYDRAYTSISINQLMSVNNLGKFQQYGILILNKEFFCLVGQGNFFTPSA